MYFIKSRTFYPEKGKRGIRGSFSLSSSVFQSEKREVKILICSRLVDCGSEHRSTLQVQLSFDLLPDFRDCIRCISNIKQQCLPTIVES